jgi:uncharacterized protein
MTVAVGSADALRDLTSIVRETPWLLEILRTIAAAAPPGSYAAAGVIRNCVWDFLHGRRAAEPTGDVDVIYHDPACLRVLPERQLESSLPQYRWEVTNQATVHLWQSAKLGRFVPPYASLDAALRSWPETATAIAVALGENGGLEVLAPFGLTDLFSLIVRPSPHLCDLDAYRCRIRDKEWQARWPRLTVLPLDPPLHG